MEEEKISVEETPTPENNQKNNKVIKLVIYIIIFVIAIVAVIFSVNGVDLNSEKQDKYSEVQKDDDNKNDEEQIEDEEQQEQNTDEEDLTTPPNEEENKNDDEDVIGNLDPYVSQIDFKVTQDDKEKLINSTNCSACLNGDIYGEMYKDEISDNFKLIYTAHELWMTSQEIIETSEHYDDFYGNVSISEKLLLENAKKIFANVEIPSTFNENIFYMGTSALSCNNGTCIFNQSTFGVTGISPFSGYENKLTIEGNDIKVEQLYIEDEYLDYNEENDTYLFDLKIYDKKGGTIIKEFKSFEINLSDEFNVYNEFSQYYEKVQTYIYKFDENNKLLEVKKVDK